MFQDLSGLGKCSDKILCSFEIFIFRDRIQKITISALVDPSISILNLKDILLWKLAKTNTRKY